jgi:hypothetical protein
LPSRYRIVLDVDARPSTATVSKVNTSPRTCGSIRSVILLWFPAGVERAGSHFQTPKASPAQLGAVSDRVNTRATRISLPCRQDRIETSLGA